MEPVFGVVYDFPKDELFFSLVLNKNIGLDHSALLNEKPILFSDTEKKVVV